MLYALGTVFAVSAAAQQNDSPVLYSGVLASEHEQTRFFLLIEAGSNVGSFAVPSRGIQDLPLAIRFQSDDSLSFDVGSSKRLLNIIAKSDEGGTFVGHVNAFGTACNQNGRQALVVFKSGKFDVGEPLSNPQTGGEISFFNMELDTLMECLRAEKERIVRDYRSKDDTFWKPAAPETLGLNKQAILTHESLCKETGADACLVVYKGQIVSEWYRTDRTRFQIRSSMKSWTSILTGMLIADGKIGGVEDLVQDYVPEWGSGLEYEVQIRHLLSMTAGFKSRGPDDDYVGKHRDATRFVLGLDLDYPPGEKWAYSNEGAQLLSLVLERAAGESLDTYARRRLLEPLGMEDTQLRLDEDGYVNTFADATASLRDFARIGLLMANNGVWNETQILSEDWIKNSTSIPSTEMNASYGLLWWLTENPRGFASLGAQHNDCFVFPDKDLVIVRLQNSGSLTSGQNYYLPALALFEEFVSDN